MLRLRLSYEPKLGQPPPLARWTACNNQSSGGLKRVKQPKRYATTIVCLRASLPDSSELDSMRSISIAQEIIQLALRRQRCSRTQRSTFQSSHCIAKSHAGR